jgi:tannase/feruloyl esterase
MGGIDMSRLLKPIVVSTVSFASFLFGATAVPAATTCEGLISLSLPHGQVTAAQTIAGGTFNTPPGCTTGSTGCTTNTGLPEFCRVAGTATPTNDSIIDFEVWIPTDGSFNGNYEQLGCGGFCGTIGYAALANAIKRGYASAATDDGSQSGGLPDFALEDRRLWRWAPQSAS